MIPNLTEVNKFVVNKILDISKQCKICTDFKVYEEIRATNDNNEFKLSFEELQKILDELVQHKVIVIIESYNVNMDKYKYCLSSRITVFKLTDLWLNMALSVPGSMCFV